MKREIILLLILSFSQNLFSKNIENIIKKIKWTGQAGIRIEHNSIIYIDPYQLGKNNPKADLILITHDHMDHLDKKSIEMISKPGTIILVPQEVKIDVKDVNIEYVKPFSTNSFLNYKIITVPAYNIKKKNFHPKSKGYLGYILEIDDVKIYHTGDTERIPEMKLLNVDIILLPLGQTYTMNSVEEAVEVLKDVGAKYAIPIHFGLYEGNKADALKFQELLKEKAKILILEKAD